MTESTATVDLSTVLIPSYWYLVSDIAVLFGVPDFTAREHLGPDRVTGAIVMATVARFMPGGYLALDPSRVTDATVAAFLAAVRSHDANFDVSTGAG